MIPALAVALTLVTRSGPSTDALTPERPYAAEFALGVAAHEAGDDVAAAAHFAAAGRLAPGAPLWPLYLALVRGEGLAPRTLTRDGGGPWRLLGAMPMHGPYFAPGGATFATGWYMSALWDGASGALVTALTTPYSQRVDWSFEMSGRYLLGARYSIGQSDILSDLEVRICGTGALAGPTLRIGRWVASGVATTWTDVPLDSAHQSEDGPWFAVRRFPLDGGTLTVHLPEPRGIRGRRNELVLRADGRRALVRTESMGIDGKQRALTWLVDPSEPEPLARQLGESWGHFSPDGALVLPNHWDDDLWVLDADSGKTLTAPDAVAETGDPRSDAIVAFAVSGGALFVASRDRVGTWDVRSAAWTATVPLVPPLDSLAWATQRGLELSVVERARVLLFRGDGGVAAYDAVDGVRLWERPDEGSANYLHRMLHDPERGRVLVEWPSGEAHLVDARTGEVVITPRRGATEACRVTSFAVAQDSAPVQSSSGVSVAATAPLECALVAAADGTLRTFELASGASLGRSSVHAGREVLGFALDDARAAREVFTWDAEGRVARLALPGLEERARVDLGAGESAHAAAPRHGVAVVVRAQQDGKQTVELRQVDTNTTVASLSLDALPRLALSDDGARVAVVAGRRVLVVAAESGTTLHDLTLAAPPLGEYCGAVAFHGTAHLVLGFGSEDFLVGGVGVGVVELAKGAVVALHRARGLSVDSFGGWVGDIESMPELGRLAYSVGSSGLVYLLDDAGFVEVAEHDTKGGNSSRLDLEQTPGSAWLYCSRMSSDQVAVFDARTLGGRGGSAVTGLGELQESPHRGFVLGLGSGRVVVLGAEELTPILERQELTGPGAQLVRGDSLTTTRDADASAWQDVHVTRGAESQPLASFAAWLDDPLGLANVTLAQLPTPPRFELGPERHVAANHATQTLAFDALDAEGALLGAWVLAAGRAPRFLAVADAAPRASFQASVDGPWPLDVELIAVSRTGLESKPWRVRITGD